jgi:diguanylate cyclase (GGDEF)-like protein
LAFSIAAVQVDVQTLLVAMLAHVFAIALVLPSVIGWRVSFGARCLIGSAVAQALAWLSLLGAVPIHDRLLSTAWVGLLGLSLVLTWHAIEAFVGPRPGRRVLWAAAVLTPLGYGLGFGDYAFRVGWSNFGLALQMALVCVAVALPARGASRRWRALVFGCLAVMAVLTLWRGVLGAFFTELYPHLRAPHPVNLASALLSPIALVLSTLGLLVAWHEEADRELRVQANHDALTGLPNRRAFAERAAGMMAQARRYGTPLALLVVDLDHFKAINDRLGHAGGDRALRTMARALQASLRRGDLACRHGGEEFCMMLAYADAAAAREFDRRLRRTLSEHAAAEGLPELRFSTGLTTLQPGDADLARLIERADAALYQAKAQGRDRLVQQPPLDMATAS